jgi:hypothetical protein
MYVTDLKLFTAKLSQVGFGINAGTLSLQGQSTSVAQGSYIVPSLDNMLPQVPVRGRDDLYIFNESQNVMNRRWFHIQNAIGTQILKYYDTLVSPLLRATKKDRIRILMKTFEKNPNTDKVRVTLEEIPMEDGKDAVARWIRGIGLEERARMYTSVQLFNGYRNKEWIFSQAAVENGLPIDVLTPSHSGWIPNDMSKSQHTYQDLGVVITAEEQPPAILNVAVDKVDCVL